MPPPAAPPDPAPRPLDLLAGFLSYVVPGLGQLYQGRVGKGLVFLVCLPTLFVYGMALDNWKNVYLLDMDRGANPWNLPPLASTLYSLVTNLYHRPQFAGQFWVGAAAWPAVWQYNTGEKSTLFGEFQRNPDEQRDLHPPQQAGDKPWDLGWVCTVSAGVLNVLVIYDAVAGPAFGTAEE